MENPVQEVAGVVHKLTQGSPSEQEETINTYFTPNASFTHPFCRTGSFEGSRTLIHAIYRWYKILSPEIKLNVNSVAYDESRMLIYLNITQLFSIWLIPFHHANVTLTTELQLVRPPSSRKYYIQSQNDLYQNDQLIRFLMPWGVGNLLVHIWQYSSTLMCVWGAFLLAPMTRLQQNLSEKRAENGSFSAEDEIRDLVSSAMEGVGYKQPSSGSSKRRSNSAGVNGNGSGSADAGASASGNGGVQQFGNMQVVS